MSAESCHGPHCMTAGSHILAATKKISEEIIIDQLKCNRKGFITIVLFYQSLALHVGARVWHTYLEGGYRGTGT